MLNKHKNILFLIPLISLSLFSCGHTHSFLETYEHDETYCWKTCQTCGEIIDKKEHSFIESEDKYVCSRCGYSKDYMAEFTNLDGDKYQVANPAIDYINDGASHKIFKFSPDAKLDDVYTPIVINWTLDKNVNELSLAYGLKDDFSDAKVITLEPNATSIKLYNLLPDQIYYLKLVEVTNKGTNNVIGNIHTASEGPRAMYVDGIANVRDIGGYINRDGKRVKTNLVLRSGQLIKAPKSSFNVNITDSGKKFLSEEIKVKHEIDFRAKEEGFPETSPIPNATLLYKVTDGYRLNDFKNIYKDIFTLLADKNNYPFIFHCEGGADRTGTFAFLLESLLNLKDLDIYRDYEFTSFSMYGKGDNYRSTIQGGYANYWQQLSDEFNKYKGANRQEKAKSYLLDAGLTEEQINNILDILLE